LYDLLVAMTKLMAPVLSFTAEEIWRTLSAQMPGFSAAKSVHLAAFPEVDPSWIDAVLTERWERLLQYRTLVQGALEEKRREKVIGSSLEANVHLAMDSGTGNWIINSRADLATLFIVSGVTQTHESSATPFFKVTVTKSTHAKCERCWNYREAVGMDAAHPTLCDRCVEAIR